MANNTPEQNRQLIEKYPFLLPRNQRDEIPEGYNYSYTELDFVPVGWRIAFCPQMLDELKQLLLEANYLEQYRIYDIKEKYGELRWYDNGPPPTNWGKYYDWQTKYITLSERTCIQCGKPATRITTDWISPYCDDCYPKRNKRGAKQC